MLDQQNVHQGTVIEWRDLTDERAQQEAQALVSAANLRIKSALDVAGISMVVSDQKHRIIYANAAMTAMLLAAQQDIQAAVAHFDSRETEASAKSIPHTFGYGIFIVLGYCSSP